MVELVTVFITKYKMSYLSSFRWEEHLTFGNILLVLLALGQIRRWASAKPKQKVIFFKRHKISPTMMNKIVNKHVLQYGSLASDMNR